MRCCSAINIEDENYMLISIFKKHQKERKKKKKPPSNAL